MGVDIRITDRQLPVSPAFIEFLHDRIEGKRIDAGWHDQLSETLVPMEAVKRYEVAQSVAQRVLEHPLGQKTILRSYELLTALMLGGVGKLKDIQDRYRFICVVGCPRHGGSYLTKHLFSALGYDPVGVPVMVAHDGFPDAGPFRLLEDYNGYTTALQQTAEYLAMVEVFFTDARRFDRRIVVPKKATKAAYMGAFYANVFGPAAEYIITLRHPAAACISTYEKSGGLPADGKFQARGNIEGWAKRDLAWLGFAPGAIEAGDYFDVYLRYWEEYHCNLALRGLSSSSRNWTVVAYGGERMARLARSFYERFGSTAAPDEFQVFDRRSRHPSWNDKSEKAVARVAQMWKLAGLAFPVEEVMEAW
jgi:hypothetical protein